MNAAAPADLMEVTDYHNGSDSDTNVDSDEAAEEFYQPVSAVDSEDEDDNDGDVIHSQPQLLSNGVTVNQVERGISSLLVNDPVERDNLNSSSEDEGEEVETAVASDSEIMWAFREDENRRNAPLTADNATRVREAMRGISFAGSPPPWAGRIPEDNWMDRLRGLARATPRN